MGWLYRDRPLRHDRRLQTVDPVDFFRRELTFTRDGVSSTVLDAAAVGSTVYAAVRNVNYPQPGSDYVYCAVILFRNNERDGFGYKDMCESMGPHEADCPDRIMRLLSPVEQIPNPSYTAAWRQRVADNKQKRRATRQLATQLKPGVIIRLEHEASFGKSSVTAIEFQLRTFRKRTPVFEAVGHPGFLCRLPQRMLGTATIVPPSPFDTAARLDPVPPPGAGREPDRRLL